MPPPICCMIPLIKNFWVKFRIEERLVNVMWPTEIYIYDISHCLE